MKELTLKQAAEDCRGTLTPVCIKSSNTISGCMGILS